jgi:azurin
VYASLFVCLFGGGVAMADGCRITIEANDMMQFNQRLLSVPGDCAEVELTLKHVGAQTARVMGHNWVLSRTRDAAALANAGASAGFDHNYQLVGDERIVAATKIVGGGESTTIKFSTSALQASEDYSFFCSSPGHFSMMKGKFKIGAKSSQLAAQRNP